MHFYLELIVSHSAEKDEKEEPACCLQNALKGDALGFSCCTTQGLADVFHLLFPVSFAALLQQADCIGRFTHPAVLHLFAGATHEDAAVWAVQDAMVERLPRVGARVLKLLHRLPHSFAC